MTSKVHCFIYSCRQIFDLISNRSNGIKAICSFAIIPKFDLALGFPVDWMHCVLLGVSKSLMNFWILSKYDKENFYLGNTVRFYNHNFNNLKNLSVFCCLHKLSIKKVISRNNLSKLWLSFKAHDSHNSSRLFFYWVKNGSYDIHLWIYTSDLSPLKVFLL